MMKRRKGDHVTMKGDLFVCNHCGTTFRPTLPALVDDFTKAARVFFKTHRDCPAPAVKQ